MKITIISIFILGFLAPLSAQIPDSIKQRRIISDSLETNLVVNDSTNLLLIDSLLVIEESTSDYPNPKRAALLGLAIPGAGHIYNKKGWYWKVPLVSSGLVGGIWFIQYNQSRFNITTDAYCQKLLTAGTRDAELGCPDLSNASIRRSDIYDGLIATTQYDVNATKNLRDSFDKNLQLSWIGIVGGHLLLNGVWPFVDAHLTNFDLSDDLTLKLKPSSETITATNSSVLGFSIALEF